MSVHLTPGERQILEGSEFVVFYPQLNPLWISNGEFVRGPALMDKLQEYMDSIPKHLLALYSTVSLVEPLEIRARGGGIDHVEMCFKTRKFDIKASVTLSQSQVLNRFFLPVSSGLKLEKPSYSRKSPHFISLSPNLRKLSLIYVANLNITALFGEARNMPFLRELEIQGSSLSSAEFSKCLSSTGVIEVLSLEIAHQVDESTLREARHGRLKELKITMCDGNWDRLYNEEGERVIHAVPSLNKLTIGCYGREHKIYTVDKKGFEYKDNRWVALSGKEREELEKIKQSKTAVLKHAPNLNTIEIDLFTLPAFQSVRVLHITGDYLV